MEERPAPARRGAASPRPRGSARGRGARRRRGSGTGIAILIFLPIVILLTAACFLLYLQLPHPKRDLMGGWHWTRDHRAEAVEAAQEWLEGAALGHLVRAADYLAEGSVDTVTDLTFSPDGSYALAADEEAWQRARQAGLSGLSEALCALIALRLRAAGAEDEATSAEAVRSLFARATGGTPEDYLAAQGPKLIPTLEELREGDAGGRYALDGEGTRILWDGREGTAFLLNGDLLALSGGRWGEQTLFRRAASREARLSSGGAQEASWEQLLPGFHGLPRKLRVSLPSLALTAYAKNFRIAENLDTVVEPSGGRATVKALHSEYENNRFLSLRDVAEALRGTSREFALTVGNVITIATGAGYEPVGGEGEPFDLIDGTVYSTKDLKANEMTIDGRSVRYYTYLGTNTAGKADLFINLTDLCLLFDMNASVQDGVLTLRTDGPLSIDMGALRDKGFYDEMRAAVVGDATTGEIYEGYRRDLAIPIASTTKLMTYAVIMDAITAGEISLGDEVSISARAAALSQGQDRVIPMTEGQQTNVRELLQAMLIASSNESALALAEHVAGTEEAFVERMRKKAVELGLSDATVFHNCNGLPVFADDVSTAKMQNHMCAEDMFRVASYLLNVYPQVTDITSLQRAALPTLGMDIKTTNALLYNLPGVTGLKTGTTNMAGACIVVSYHLETAAGPHDLVAVVLGAEDNTVRFSSSEILLRYAKQRLLGGETEEAGESAPGELPADAEGIVRLVMAAREG